MQRLAIITTHPIQYYAPVFKLLNERGHISIRVFYTLGKPAGHDHGFGKAIAWDIPLLEGYPYEWVQNTSAEPGSHHYKGIVNPGIIKQLTDWQPDAVLIFGWSYRGHLSATRHFKNKVPVFFRGDSTLLDPAHGIKSILKNVSLRWVYRHIDHAFYVGTNNKAYFKKYGLKDSQLSFAPHAVDNERFAVKRDGEAGILRKQLGVPGEDILILFAGKFVEKKAPLLLVEAFLSLQKDGVHLLLVGNGELEQQLKAKATPAKNIHFMDFQNQSYMPVVYQACDLFCLPSKGPGETWGLAVNEAMACGKAVLTSDKVGCAIDLVRESVNGSVFKSGDMAGLSKCLEQLTNSKTTLQAFGKRSGELIADWNFVKIAEAIEHKLIKN